MLPRRRLTHTRKTVINMSEVGWDINEEYEKIYGAAKRVNLFDSEDEYDELRQYILSQPQWESFLSNKLPFDNIVLQVNKSKPIIDDIKNTIICNILSALQNKHKDTCSTLSTIEPVVPEKHLFFIKKDGICDAMGYYDDKVKYFFVCKDSLVSYNTDLIYLLNDTENARENFLKKRCEESKGYYRVIRDAKCRSASAAACYVLGYMADQTCWLDSDGKMLSDVYPDVFISVNQERNGKVKKEKVTTQEELPLLSNEQLPIKESKQIVIVHNPPKEKDSASKNKFATVGRSPRYYYIDRENMGNRSCHAKGMYDKVNDKFIILEGSELSREVTSSYRFTASDIKRNKFVKLNAIVSSSKIILKRDSICNSPNEAACFVLGENVNGLVEWKSKDGIPLEAYIIKD